MIDLENVTKLYNTVIGVNDITLHLAPGTYGLLGPNGSGKTTLINLIIGQLRPTIGRVRLFGTNPWSHGRLLSRVGMCPAVDISHHNASGFEWVTLMVRLYGYSAREAKRRAIAALEKVSMTEAMHRTLNSYSLGMRQRCKLAQAIAHDPELLILDEPFNGLDPVGRFEMTQFLRHWASDGRSMILASHILHEVEAVHPSLLLISGGRLLASGSPEEVRSILANCPNAVFLRSSDPHRLAARIAHLPTIESIQFDVENQGITVSTQAPLALLQSISGLNNEGIQLHEIRTADESLQDIFSTLMRIHRGEIAAP